MCQEHMVARCVFSFFVYWLRLLVKASFLIVVFTAVLFFSDAFIKLNFRHVLGFGQNCGTLCE